MADRYASLKQGLVGCWIPSISGSGLLLPDLSGRGNNGALTNMDASDWVSSQYGRALDFDGVDDSVVASGNTSFTNGVVSVSGWMRRTGTAGVNNAVVFSKGTLEGNANSTCALYWNETLGWSWFIVDAANNLTIVRSNTVTSQNQWVHVGGIASPAGVFLYLNGVLANSTTTAAVKNSTHESFIGGASVGGGTFTSLLGQAGDVRAYNRALTESEIRLLASEPGIGFKRISSSAFATRYAYKPAKPRNYSVIRNRDPNYSTLRQGLVAAYCPSISGQGNVLPDLVGGNHGTLTNMSADDWVSSGDGRALDFDGSNDVVSISGSVVYAQNGQPFTASIHAYVRNFTNQYTKLLMLRSDCVNGNAWEFGVSDQSAYLGILIGTNGSYARIKTDTLAATITSGWHHYLVVYNGGDRSQSTSFRIYFDGTLQVNSGAIDFSGTTNTSSISLNAANNRLNGVADDVRIYSRALTEPEIKLLASKRGIGLQPRNTHVTFADLGVQKTYSVVRVKETDYATLRQGLVGAWCPSLPNGGSGNTLPDVSGYNNHGVLTNMGPEDWVSGQYGRALDIFDDQHIDGGTMQGLSLAYPFSMSCWIQNITSNNIDFSPFAKTRQVGTYQGPMIYFASATNATVVAYWAGGTRATGATVVTQLSNWTHVGICWTGSQARVYVNGRLDGTGNTATAPDASTASVNIGRYNSEGFGQRSMRGRIDDCRIYDRCLTDSEWSLLASRPGIGLRQESHRNTFYQFPSFQPALAKRSSVIIGGGIT